MSPTEVVIRVLLLVALAWLASSALRKSAAALRALIWSAALGGAVVLPLLAALAPAWRVEITRPTPVVPALAAVDDVTVATPATGIVLDAGRPPAAAALVAPPPASASWRIDVDLAALAGALTIALLLVVRLAAGHARLSNIARRASTLDDPAWSRLVAELCRQIGVRSPVDVRISDAIGVPAVVGVLRPRLLLPIDATEWTDDLRRAVLLHELAHIARRDPLAQLIGHVACTLYWFLPPVWTAARRAAALRERASDDVVLLAGVTPAIYADSLVRLARSATGADLPAVAVAMARPSRLRERVVAILDPATRRTAPRALSGAIVAMMVAIAATLAAIEPAMIDPRSPESPQMPADRSADVHWIGEPAAPPAPRGERRRPASQTASRPCSGKLESSSGSVNDNNGVRKWKVDLSGNDCKATLQAEGRIEFTEDFTDVRSIGPGGFFRIDVTERGVRRQLELEPRDGALTRRWRVDGRDAAYDDAARAWFAAMLVELDRRLAIGVDVRLPHLLKQGGVDAVLTETALMSGDYARNEYYTRLARATTLSPPDVTRVLRQAASLTKSDHYAHQLIAAFAGAGVEDAGQREAIVALIDGMDSDHYRAESIQVLLSRGRPSAAEMDLLVRMLPKMTSDHYKVQTLTRVVRAGSLTADQQAALLRSASSVESDYYAAEFLKTVAGDGPLPAGARQALIDSIGGIESDHYASEVLTFLLTRGANAALEASDVVQLVGSIESDHYRTEVLSALLTAPGDRSERVLLGVVAAAARMSDHYESTVLRRVLGERGANERVQAAVLDAAAKLSSHYAEQVRRAARR